jgi:hypothetical protein
VTEQMMMLVLGEAYSSTHPSQAQMKTSLQHKVKQITSKSESDLTSPAITKFDMLNLVSISIVFNHTALISVTDTKDEYGFAC